MQNFAGSSRGPKPMILKPRIIDSYTGRTTQRAAPFQPALGQSAPPMVPPQPFGQPPTQAVSGRGFVSFRGAGGPRSVSMQGDDSEDPYRKRAQPVPYLAKGGPAKAGMPHIVGELGPELFIPDQDGQIVAHAKLKKAMKQNRKKKPEKSNPFYP